MTTEVPNEGFDLIVKIAPARIHGWLLEMYQHVDNVFGDGYAKAHPELVLHLVQLCAHHVDNRTFTKALGSAIGHVGDKVQWAGR